MEIGAIDFIDEFEIWKWFEIWKCIWKMKMNLRCELEEWILEMTLVNDLNLKMNLRIEDEGAFEKWIWEMDLENEFETKV